MRGKLGKEYNLIEVTQKRIGALVNKDKKSKSDYEEIEALASLLKTLEKTEIEKIKADSGGKRGKRTGSKKGKRNDITNVKWDEIKKPEFFEYQIRFIKSRHRFHFLLKSRQIGFSWACAWKIIELMIESKGNNCVVISASKAQAFVIRDYIVVFCAENLGIEVDAGGDEIKFTKDGKPWSKCRFRGSNSWTGQSYSAHLFIDECFWVPGFDKVEKAARPIAMHAKWTRTYFSAPSFKSHPAYRMWMPDDIEDFILDAEGPDGCYREIIDLETAIAQGFNLQTKEQIQKEYKDDYAQLCGCEFVDDNDSVFPWTKIEHLMKDTSAWDWKELRESPSWGGSDPSLRGDDAAFGLVSPPTPLRKKYKVLITETWNNVHFEGVSNGIKELTADFNMTQFALDYNGLGEGFLATVEKWFPHVCGLWYSNQIKNEIVGKAKDIFDRGLIELPIDDYELANALVRIKRKPTKSGHALTYESDRIKKTGDHADKGWAIINALSFHEYTEELGTSISFIS